LDVSRSQEDGTLGHLEGTLDLVAETLGRLQTSLVEEEARLGQVDPSLVQLDARLAQVDRSLVQLDAPLYHWVESLVHEYEPLARQKTTLDQLATARDQGDETLGQGEEPHRQQGESLRQLSAPLGLKNATLDHLAEPLDQEATMRVPMDRTPNPVATKTADRTALAALQTAERAVLALCGVTRGIERGRRSATLRVHSARGGKPMGVSVVLVLLSVPVLLWTGYLAGLALLSSANRPPREVSGPKTRFEVVVPAHDEELGIATTVQNLLGVDYPAERRRVVVVADNCSDGTAASATAAGATVLERRDSERRGKGYALAYAFERALSEGRADAVVVVDADTQVTPNLLRAFDARLQAGARAIQAEYVVANREASWRTRLMHIGFTLFHDVRSRARERLEVSAGLRGNGMAFATSLLREVPHDAFSVVEDVEYGIRLGRAGYRVHYAGDARVFGEMVSSERASRSQRQRWEGGRLTLAKQHALALLAEGLRKRSLLLLDLAADLLVPPLTYVALSVIVGVAASALWIALAHGRYGAWWAAAPWAAALAGFAIYVVRGVWLSRVGPRAILDLAWAPVYMAWKVVLALRSSSSSRGEWVRTAREGEKP